MIESGKIPSGLVEKCVRYADAYGCLLKIKREAEQAIVGSKTLGEVEEDSEVGLNVPRRLDGSHPNKIMHFKKLLSFVR